VDPPRLEIVAVNRPSVVFVGFMGAGKSAVLRALVPRWETADTDKLLEAELGMSIAEFFEREGEAAFRVREEEVVLRTLEEAHNWAIALGGGSVLSERVRAALQGHTVVWLQVDAETAWSRVAGRDRPLARDRVSFEALLAERTPLYESIADAILPETGLKDVASAAFHLFRLDDLPGARMLWARSGSGSYPVFVGQALLAAPVILDPEVAWWPLPGRRFCVSDATVAGRYADALGPLEALIEIEPGEGSKTMAEAERVLGELARAEMTREDHVVALGGGVVGDLAGFCAHTYQRGVPVIQVPTTLVAQVDSAYGGKTGVDLPEGKNYAGAYHLPAAVLTDTAALATLPTAELSAGFVEALKTGLLAGGDLWERVRTIEALDPEALDDVVFACARYKCELVASDERDSGRRAVLNLGHTVGHAIEAASGYRLYRHGEAVGLGLLAALRLSGAPELRDEVEEILRRHDLPTALAPEIDVDATLDALQRDKKRTAEGVGFVLLSTPGEPREGQLVDPDRVRAAVEELKR
jgi:shikimate kinase/3-dehydroquinate synthase